MTAPISPPGDPNGSEQARGNPYNAANASRIYLLPNLMTAGNLFCGFLAVIKCIQARMAMSVGEWVGHTASELFTHAVWLILVAVIFDSLDGRLARLGGRESLFGAEFDSLADVVSFGVAPALMVFFLILSPSQAYTPFQQKFFLQAGWFISFVYLLCAAVRLARFNVITNPLLHDAKKSSSKDFLGLPVPAAAGTVASLVLFLLHLEQDDRMLQRSVLLLPILLLLIAWLMVSTIRFPSFKQVDWQMQTRLRTFVGLLVLAGLVVALQEVAFLILFLAYLGYGLYRHFRRRGPAAAEKAP